MLPDLPFYATYPAWLIRHGLLGAALRSNEWPTAPAWMYRAHTVSHSLPVALLAGALAQWRTGRWPVWATAWLLHIAVDVPTHARRQWAPPILWPFSHATVDGVSWPEALLALVLRRKRARPPW